MTDEIRPCPLCGEKGDAIYGINLQAASRGEPGVHAVQCEGCKLQSTPYECKPEAIAEWNRLAMLPVLVEACTIALDYFIINREGADPERDRIRPILQAAVDKAKGV